MRVNMAVVAEALSKARLRPEEAFPFFRPSEEDVDRAEIVDFLPSDEREILAGRVKPEHAKVLRSTRISSCSAATHEELLRCLERARRYNLAVNTEILRRHEEAKKGSVAISDFKPPAESEEERPRGALAILLARALAEGIEGWEPAPKAIVTVAAAKLKRFDPFPEPLSAHIPADPFDYSLGKNVTLLQAVEALPNRYAERVLVGILWISQLSPSRFVEARMAEQEAGKSSASPSATPSSGSGGANGKSEDRASTAPTS